MRTHMLAAALIGAVVLSAESTSTARELLQGEPPALKSSFGNKQAVKALADAFLGFEEDGRRNGGKPPRDARGRVVKMREMAGPAKAEIRAFVSRLQSNNEAAAFDARVYEHAQKQAPAVVSGIRSAGGPTAMLAKADGYIDEMIADREKVAAKESESKWPELLGVATLHAYGLRSGLCSGFWYILTVGYGESFAYRSCYY